MIKPRISLVRLTSTSPVGNRLTSSARISRHGVVYGVQEGRITYREDLSLEVRESQLSLRI